MAEQHHHYETTRSSGNGSLAFIVGGLVVAVGVIAWLIFGDGFGTTETGAAPTNVEINATSDSSAGAADSGAVADTADDAGASAGAEAATDGAAAGAEASSGN